MAENRKCFIFIWEIKNFGICLTSKFISSAPFCVHAIGGTNWKLVLYTNSDTFQDSIACYIMREENDSGPKQFELDYELAFLDRDGYVLLSERCKKVHIKGKILWKTALHARKEEICFLKKDLFIPDDTLTIRCIIWHSQRSLTQSVKCLCETSITNEWESSVGIIKKFSSVKPGEKYPVCIKLGSQTHLKNLSISADGLLIIEIGIHLMTNYRCKIFILDKFGNRAITSQRDYNNDKSQCYPLTLSKDYLIKNKEYFLPNDELTILCKICFYELELRHEIDYIFDWKDTKEMKSRTKSSNSSHGEHYVETINTLQDDMTSLFRESILCDTTLKTAEETFPAHMSVLSARSPVFKSIFTTDMKEREKTNSCVDIDDLDANTVRKMLLFIYSDTLTELEYVKAKNLYFAADKYNIVSLKRKCSNLLKQDFLQSNCCDILLLADKHKDKDLKSAVQDYIENNNELVSDSLKDLEYDKIKSLYSAADKYSIVSLKHRCSNFLKQNFLQSNCCDILLLADKHHDEELKCAVQDYIAKNDEVLSSVEWRNLEKNHPLLTIEVFRFMYMKIRRN